MSFYFGLGHLERKIREHPPFTTTSNSEFYILSEKDHLVAQVYTSKNSEHGFLSAVKAQAVNSAVKYLIQNDSKTKTKTNLITIVASYIGIVPEGGKINTNILLWPGKINSLLIGRPSLEACLTLQYYGCEVLPYDKNLVYPAPEEIAERKAQYYALETSPLLCAEALKRAEELPLDKKVIALEKIAKVSLLNALSGYPARLMAMYSQSDNWFRPTYSWKDIVKKKAPRKLRKEAELYAKKALGEQYELGKENKTFLDLGLSKESFDILRSKKKSFKPMIEEIMENAKSQLVFVGPEKIS